MAKKIRLFTIKKIMEGEGSVGIPFKGTLSHEEPAPSIAQIEKEKAAQTEADRTIPPPNALPEEAAVAKSAQVVLVPTMRFDGGTEIPPWHMAEANLWDTLVSAPIDQVEEQIVDGSSGCLWGRMTNVIGDRFSVLIRLDGLKTDHYKTWKAEYLLSLDAGFIGRETVAYEVAKACGMEDIVPPLAARELDMESTLSEPMKDDLARNMKVARVDVGKRVGSMAIVQVAVPNSTAFSVKWASLAPTDEERWVAASDTLRHSLYRAMALDFLLWTGERSLAGLTFNEDADRIAITDLSLSLPHPGFSAEKYMRQRTKGWNRNEAPGVAAIEGGPAHAMDIFRLTGSMAQEHRQECIATFQQVSDLMTDQAVPLLVKIFLESGIPLQCIAGFLARVSYLKDNPAEVIKDPIIYVRNVLAPTRRGFGLGGNETVIHYISQMIAAAGVAADFTDICQEILQDSSLKLI